MPPLKRGELRRATRTTRDDEPICLQSLDEGLAVGESVVGLDEGLAVGESVVGLDEGMAVGELVVG